MQKVIDIMKKRAIQLLNEGVVDRVLGWKAGEFDYDQSPAVFSSVESLDGLVYDSFSGPNLSKYLIEETKKDGKILAFLKPCDTYSFNQLIKEHRIDRSKVYVIGVECGGKVDTTTLRARGAVGITGVEDEGETVLVHTLYGDMTFNKNEVLLEKCQACKGKEHKAFDELIIVNPVKEEKNDRFADTVQKVLVMVSFPSASDVTRAETSAPLAPA